MEPAPPANDDEALPFWRHAHRWSRVEGWGCSSQRFPHVVGAGALGAAGLVCVIAATDFVPTTVVHLIRGTEIVFVAILGVMMKQQTLDAKAIAAIGVMVVGIFLITASKGKEETNMMGDDTSDALFGIGLALLSNIQLASRTVLSKKAATMGPTKGKVSCY